MMIYQLHDIKLEKEGRKCSWRISNSSFSTFIRTLEQYIHMKLADRYNLSVFLEL